MLSLQEKILQWIGELEDWKQDAAVRILVKGDCDDSDIEELARMLLFKKGLIEGEGLTPKHINKKLTPTPEKSKAHTVVLKKIRSPHNVNALSPDGELTFASSGMTIIYGANGSGKSGYNRILKKCCKASKVRGAGVILGNVYKNSKESRPSAKIVYNDDNNKDKELEWIDGERTSGILKHILVHDSRCGQLQVNNSNELIYLPDGADIFEKLSLCFNRVKEKIEKDYPKKSLPDLGINIGTRVYERISTTIKNRDKTKILSGFEFTDEKRNRLFKIRQLIANTDKEEARKKTEAFENEAEAISRVLDFLVTNEKYFLKDHVEKTCRQVRNRNELKTALDDLAKKMQEGEFIEGTGNDRWRAMYEAARSFVEGIVGSDSKHLAVEEKCALCQQPLDTEAQKRMQTFFQLAEEKLKKNHDNLSRQINDRMHLLNELEAKLSYCSGIMKRSFSCVAIDESKAIVIHLEQLERAKKEMIQFIKNEAEDSSVSSLSSSKILFVKKILSNIRAKKDELQKTITPQQLADFEKEKKELEALKSASEKIEQLRDHIDHLKKYDDTAKYLQTTSISKKGTELVTEALGEKFANELVSELEKLEGERIPLYVDKSTIKGEPTFQLKLRNAHIPQGHKLESVLSEGEQKIASLAGFFAEIATADHKNGIILDDPVTSLDQQFRTKIAARLVNESLNRQVIIFTHDIAFLFELEYFSETHGIKPFLQDVKKNSVCGIVSSELPWHAQNVEDRIKYLKDRVRGLKDSGKEGEEYNKEAGTIYGYMREAWEKLIEDILLNKTVTRFSQEVQTKRLREVAVGDEDYKVISEAMSKCSRHMIGHDKASVLSCDRPRIAEIKADIDKIKEYKGRIKNRRSAHNKPLP